MPNVSKGLVGYRKLRLRSLKQRLSCHLRLLDSSEKESGIHAFAPNDRLDTILRFTAHQPSKLLWETYEAVVLSRPRYLKSLSVHLL